LGATAVSKYLNSHDPDAISPELAALAYAADRAETRETLEALLHNPEIDFVICDRYVGSNMAHQSARMSVKSAAASLRDAIYALEHNINGMPLPDVQILLDVPVEEAAARLQAKGGKLDNHEMDNDYLRRTRDAYLAMVPDDTSIKVVGCHVAGEAIKEKDEHRIVTEFGDAVDEDVDKSVGVVYASPRTTSLRVFRTVLNAYAERQRRSRDRVHLDMVVVVEERDCDDTEAESCTQTKVEESKGNCCNSGTPSCSKTTTVPESVEEASESVIAEEPQPAD